jgi:TetR/AcrR family transcriptional regulator, transcriptional repressor of bet genes
MEDYMPGKKIPEDRRREQILEAVYRVALRQRLAGLSSRAVSSEAGVSNGLVFFHFRNRRELLLALLDWLLEETILRRAVDRTAESESASSRLTAEMRTAVEALVEERERIELFFDYWFMSSRDEVIRKRIRSALKRYRDSYLTLTRAVVMEQPVRYAGVSGEALADIVTSFIEGCALRLVTEPRSYDAEAYSKGISALLNGGTRTTGIKPKNAEKK